MLIMQNRAQLFQGPHASISPWLSNCLHEGCFMTTPNQKRWETVQKDEGGRKKGKREVRGKKIKRRTERARDVGFFLFCFFKFPTPAHVVSHSGPKLSVSIDHYQAYISGGGQFTKLRGINVSLFPFCLIQLSSRKAGMCGRVCGEHSGGKNCTFASIERIKTPQ